MLLLLQIVGIPGGGMPVSGMPMAGQASMMAAYPAPMVGSVFLRLIWQ